MAYKDKGCNKEFDSIKNLGFTRCRLAIVTFFSRSKNQLWTKGETSGNQLELVTIFSDCDQDTLLIKAHPTGPICHTNAATCFLEENEANWKVIQDLEEIILKREKLRPKNSYTSTPGLSLI